jgi:hypothetical protein
MAMIAMTTSSSISVEPRLLRMTPGGFVGDEICMNWIESSCT